jgi:hypothetical protein
LTAGGGRDSVLRRRAVSDSREHPNIDDVLLAVEVADTTVRFDGSSRRERVLRLSGLRRTAAPYIIERQVRMEQRASLWLGIFAVIALAAAPGTTLAGPSSDSLLELAGKGGPSASLGFGVAPLRWELIAPLPGIAASTTAAEGRTLADQDALGRAVSVDFKLRWPAADFGLEPYLVLGPALLVEQRYDPSDLMGAPADPTFRLAAKAGAGFNWQLSRSATLFGSYDITTTGVDALGSARTKAPVSGVPTEHELLYGLRFRY